MTPVRPEVTGYVERKFAGAEIEKLTGDASSRIFYRVRLADGSSVVLMDYGKPFRDETDDLRLGRVFRRAGLRVADVLDASSELGCLVMEDLGDRSLESVLRSETATAGDAPPPYLARAVELAARISSRGTPALAASERAPGPALDAERFRFEMDFFLKHFAGDLMQKRGLAPELVDALHDLADRAADSPERVLCHRDFHSRNLMVLEDGNLAMVDIQDARWGPDSYDLASLLRDAYVDVRDSWLDPLIELYLGILTDPPESAAFRRRFDRVAAQRMIKALGSFGHLTRKLKTKRYLEAVPRTVARLTALLPSLPETRQLFELLARHELLPSRAADR